MTSDTTIIAVCGPNDIQQNAHPEKDGWSFSDFYLFHHLFRGTTKNQHWLTCVKPQDLVQQYKEFIHGDPRSSDRRIVLDKTFSAEVQDVLVFHPNDLLERFTAYTTNSCEAAKDSQQPILILIFGQGQADTFGITIGGGGEFEKCPLMSQSKFKEAIYRHNPSPNIALLTTSCFGDGWTQTSFLNISAMSGTNKHMELLSWPQSESLGRFCGSRYATRVAQALIRSEIQGLDMESEIDINQSPTLATLVDIIHDIHTQEIDEREQNLISLAAKDDLWGMEWRARTGFPLTTYLEKWESLRLVPQGDSSGIALSASVRFSDFIRLSISEAEFRLKRLAFDYLTSNPGDDSAAKNHVVHSYCHKVLKGKTLSVKDLEKLSGALNYRLRKIIARTTDFKDRLGITFPDCRDCNINSLIAQLKDDYATSARHSDIRSMAFRRHLFDEPQEYEGMPYIKGDAYLVIVLT